MDAESGVLGRGGCEPESVSSVDGDFERLGRSTSRLWGIGVGSVASVPLATLGLLASAVFWGESRS